MEREWNRIVSLKSQQIHFSEVNANVIRNCCCRIYGMNSPKLFLVPHFLLKIMDSMLLRNFKYLSDFRIFRGGINFLHSCYNTAKGATCLCKITTTEALYSNVMLENTNNLHTASIIWKGFM